MANVTKKVKLDTVNSVKEFVQETCKAPFDVTAGSGRYIVDAKSIMGLISLNLSNPVEITFETNDDTEPEKVSAFLDAIDRFIVKE